MQLSKGSEPMQTSISIVGLQSYAYHGMCEEERRLGQKFCFDVHARLSGAVSHRDDQLESSVRYDEVVAQTINVATASTFQTLEALAEAIARRVISFFVRVESVIVVVSKLSPPIQEPVQRVEVEVQLSRAEFGQENAHG